MPGSALILGEYMKLRSKRHESLQNEATLNLMLKEFPALALVDVLTDFNKAKEVFSQIVKALTSGTQ